MVGWCLGGTDVLGILVSAREVGACSCTLRQDGARVSRFSLRICVLLARGILLNVGWNQLFCNRFLYEDGCPHRWETVDNEMN